MLDFKFQLIYYFIVKTSAGLFSSLYAAADFACKAKQYLSLDGNGYDVFIVPQRRIS